MGDEFYNENGLKEYLIKNADIVDQLNKDKIGDSIAVFLCLLGTYYVTYKSHISHLEEWFKLTGEYDCPYCNGCKSVKVNENEDGKWAKCLQCDRSKYVSKSVEKIDSNTLIQRWNNDFREGNHNPYC